MADKKHVALDPDVHERLKRFGMLGETFSEAVDRAMDEAEANEAHTESSDDPLGQFVEQHD